MTAGPEAPPARLWCNTPHPLIPVLCRRLVHDRKTLHTSDGAGDWSTPRNDEETSN